MESTELYSLGVYGILQVAILKVIPCLSLKLISIDHDNTI